MVFAYSYVRFSTPDQAKGDSFRRQIELAEAYCKRMGWKLSTDTYKDLGVSARRGKNALVGNLGEFLKALPSIKPGSVLVVESLDRITRQGIDEGYEIIKRLLKAGILLVTLTPERQFDVSATKSLSKGALEIQLILERAAEESERKSERCYAAWVAKRRLGGPMTPIAPPWLRVEGKQFVVIEERAEIIRRIFRMAADGYGVKRIATILNDEAVPCFGNGRRDRRMNPADGIPVRWSRVYVFKLLKNRAVLGEYQPHTIRNADGKRRADGEPMPGYYPAVVDEGLWHAAHAAMKGRKGTTGRPAKRRTNIFTGLLFDASTGEKLYAHKKGSRVSLEDACGHYIGFMYEPFEDAILERLREIKPEEVIPAEDKTHSRTDILQGRIDELNAKIAKSEQLFQEHPSDSLARILKQYDQQKKSLDAELEDAKREAATPLSSAFNEIKSQASTEAERLRLRTAVNRAIERVSCRFASIGIDRYAFVTLHFRNGNERCYLIHRKPHEELSTWSISKEQIPEDAKDLAVLKQALKQIEEQQ